MKKKIALLMAGAMLVASVPAFAAPAMEQQAFGQSRMVQQLDSRDDDDWGCPGRRHHRDGHGYGCGRDGCYWYDADKQNS